MHEANNINQAGTLLEIVQKAKSIHAQGINTSFPNWPSLFWAKVFDLLTPSNRLEPDDDAEVMSRLIQLRKLIHETEKSLRSIEGINHDLFLRPFPRIQQVVNLLDLSAGFNTIINITDGDIAVLEFCSDKLSERHSELTISKGSVSGGVRLEFVDISSTRFHRSAFRAPFNEKTRGGVSGLKL